MALDDLKRLRISTPHEHTARGGRLGIALLCVICLVLGFVAARVSGRMMGSKPMMVSTAVVRPFSGGEAKQFTAGGWIEVATPQYPLHVVARISERLEEVCVHPGQTVQPGDVVARLYDKDQKDHLVGISADLVAAQTNLAKFTAGYRSQDIDTADARMKETAQRLELATLRLNRNSNLWSRNVISRDEYDNAVSTYKYALANHASTLAELDKMHKGYRAEEVGEVKAAADRLAAEFALATRGVEYCTLRAPEHDRPLRVLKIYRAVGAWINADKEDMPTIVSLYDPTRMQMRVDVSQANIKYVSIGAPVTVVTEANKGRQYRGVVLRVEPLAEIAKNTITVRVALDDPDDMLFPEMVAQATFMSIAQTNEVAGGLAVPTDALIEKEGAYTAMVVENGRARLRDVKIERHMGGQAIIASGLRSGQRVILNPSAVRDGQEVAEQ